MPSHDRWILKVLRSCVSQVSQFCNNPGTAMQGVASGPFHDSTNPHISNTLPCSCPLFPYQAIPHPMLHSTLYKQSLPNMLTCLHFLAVLHRPQGSPANAVLLLLLLLLHLHQSMRPTGLPTG